jgi:hypothetical protein
VSDAITSPVSSSGDGALDKYINYEQGVLQHAISVADAKATFVLTIALALALFSLPDVLIAFHGADSLGHRLFAVVTELILLGSGGAAFFTVLPRVSSVTSDTAIAWMSKVFSGTAPDFIDQCRSGVTLERLQVDQLNHLYILARICREKYRDLRLALWFIPLGLAFLICERLLS